MERPAASQPRLPQVVDLSSSRDAPPPLSRLPAHGEGSVARGVFQGAYAMIEDALHTLETKRERASETLKADKKKAEDALKAKKKRVAEVLKDEKEKAEELRQILEAERKKHAEEVEHTIVAYRQFAEFIRAADAYAQEH
nr:tubby-related protein 1-like isoform X2 [Ipomoea batatas]